MSDIEKLFLAAYPLWPKVLLEKFSSLLSFEIAKFNPEINPQIIEQYKALSGVQSIIVQPDIENHNTLLNPENQSKLVRAYYGKYLQKLYYSKLSWSDEYIEESASPSAVWGDLIYDTRLFTGFSTSLSVSYADSARMYYYKTMESLTGSDRYETYQLNDILPVCALQVYPVTTKYAGASSVLAMIENGLQIELDRKLLSEFVTFLIAYSKYSSELAAFNNLQAEKNRQSLSEYKQSVGEKLISRKNDLSDLKTQISFAAKNETNSGKRDMQNLSIAAQSLFMQLQEKLAVK